MSKLEQAHIAEEWRKHALPSVDQGSSRIPLPIPVALWKDADSDIPILQQAKAEYAKLQ